MPRSAEYDLRRADDIAALLNRARALADPSRTVTIHAAARVGGIGANLRRPATYFYDNFMMGSQLLDAACHCGISKFVGIGTVCSDPSVAASHGVPGRGA